MFPTRRARILALLATLLLHGGYEQQVIALLLLLLSSRQKKNRRWGPRGRYDRVKSKDYLDNLVFRDTDRYFKTHLRMSREGFWHLHDLIKDLPVFVSSGKKKQKPVWIQLATFLLRWGMEPGVKAPKMACISEGCTYNYCNRVANAFRSIRDRHLAWPGQQRRAFLKSEMTDYGFPGCIGIVDGSAFGLHSRPRKDGFVFFSGRKKIYCIAVQIICDHRCIILAYEMGWPGSVGDTTVLRESAVWRNMNEFFEDDEYILADKGYPLTKHTIRPFADDELTNDREVARVRRRWNYDLSHLRVKVEHTFGQLKGRFPSLRCLPGYDLKQIWKSLEAIFVIHNILVEFGDDPTTIEGYNGVEDDDFQRMVRGAVAQADVENQNRRQLNDDALRRAGLYPRKQLLRRRYEEM